MFPKLEKPVSQDFHCMQNILNKLGFSSRARSPPGPSGSAWPEVPKFKLGTVVFHAAKITPKIRPFLDVRRSDSG